MDSQLSRVPTVEDSNESRAAKVLLIDDSPLSLEVTRGILTGEGFDVRTASNRAEFDDILVDWWPDIAVIDVQMPDVNGADLCRFLKARIDVRVVLFSGLPSPALAALAAECGADAYLSKVSGFGMLSERVLDVCRAVQVERTVLGGNATSYRVLLFDDSELSLHFESALLGLEGFDVRCAQTLAEVEKHLSDWRPHLMLTDLRMPEIDGGELCRRLKRNPVTAQTLVVLFSSVSEEQLAPLARACGADDYLSKQDGYRQLGGRLRQICDSVIW